MQFLVIRNIPIKREKSILYSEPPKETLYTKIPKIYKLNKPDKWPKITNVPCYSCTIKTKRISLFVPAIIKPNGDMYRGNNPLVCSGGCGLNWIFETTTDEAERRRLTACFITLIHVLTGVLLDNINPSAKRSELQKYGGTYTKHQYQRELLSEPYMEKLYINPEDYEADLS